ncbi:hypothetical protein [Bilophila wadsworthia]|uniref:hypothetical protein n=1 Tax=Bilophila wadsworthia TaxID=35833 RepID=UPI0026702F88|nr:hypothetical protein [Bilophila wadsworthia]
MFLPSAQGYAPEELSAMLKSAGIIIPAYLAEKFLKPESLSYGFCSAIFNISLPTCHWGQGHAVHKEMGRMNVFRHFQ